ncbi:MAG: 16S rRNA (cytosine(1402)-N(4))-methyltransferase RsmH [Oscillospiraceae bacterium]|nr:16S rRNA (cytosine(1402)-N(4))-methyltransferase RsmH [Oscillospiraceae bacterium]
MENSPDFGHVSVLLYETADALDVTPGNTYFDGTFGGGGHSRLILERGGIVRATDMDSDAIEAAKVSDVFRPYLVSGQLALTKSNFADFIEQADELFDGMIFDLGVSSHQLDTTERGFSFRRDARLDMRMDRTAPISAYEIVNEWDYEDLKRIFYEYGEERNAPRIARRIAETRTRAPIETTYQLAELLNTHPKRVFQALRIAVQDELGSLSRMLKAAPNRLKPGGVIAVISFHSLEDRLVKHSFRDDTRLSVITKHPITPRDEELRENTRSGSAKLRTARKVG